MGMQSAQKDLFSYSVDLDQRVRAENPLRRIREQIDFEFVREEVKECYGYNGNESVDPAVIMKMMFLLFLDDIASERELMRIIAERLDYLWFLGYGLDDEIPDHSVLSKARARWGVEVFETLFTRIVAQCQLAGLIAGKKLHMDGSLVQAHASNDAVLKGCPELIAQLREQLQGTMSKLDEPKDDRARIYYERKNKSLLNTTDPDAAIVRKGDGARARYKTHRAIDDAHGVITATETTPGDVEENAKLMDLVEQHERNTEHTVETVVADTQYGTAENFRACQKRGIRSHMGDMLTAQLKKGRREGIFGYTDFRYDATTDTFGCPAGQTLTRRKHKQTRQAYEYACSMGVCRACALRPQCTRAKGGSARTVKRHYQQEAIDAGRAQSQSAAAKRDRRRRKWLMEGSFADAANNHGFKRSRWRRLWRQQIQDYLIAAVQNVRILLQFADQKAPAVAQATQIFIRAQSTNLGQPSSVFTRVFRALGGFRKRCSSITAGHPAWSRIMVPVCS